MELDKSKKYSIVGVPKSGTSSLGEYMRKYKFDVIEDEMWFMDAKKYYQMDKERLNRIPIIITRNPIERVWSHYYFFKESLKKSCECSKYAKYIKTWNNPIIFKLECLKKLEDFPHHNENTTKPKLDYTSKVKIMRELYGG